MPDLLKPTMGALRFVRNEFETKKVRKRHHRVQVQPRDTGLMMDKVKNKVKKEAIRIVRSNSEKASMKKDKFEIRTFFIRTKLAAPQADDLGVAKISIKTRPGFETKASEDSISISMNFFTFLESKQGQRLQNVKRALGNKNI